jgi:hypothetical protein
MRNLTIAFVLTIGASISFAEPEKSVLRDHSFGPIHDAAAVNKAQVQAAFPGATITPHDTKEAGETHHGFVVTSGTKQLATVHDSDIVFADRDIRTDSGVGVDSSYEDLLSRYPRLTCRSGTTVSCASPTSQIEFTLVLRVKKVGAKSCSPDGPACCEAAGNCNAAALKGARVTGLKLNLEAAGR